MEPIQCFRHFSHVPTVATFLRNQYNLRKTKNRFRIAANLSSDDDPLLQAALYSASLRFQETHRPVVFGAHITILTCQASGFSASTDPLFHDPYVACLVAASIPVYTKQHVHPYCLATKFIDDSLLQNLRNNDELKQVVLLTDGADTRVYRLTWPISTLIFDISPDRIYCELSKKLRDIGAQISRSCVLLHVSLESSNIQEVLRKKGFNGNRPSIWALQGLPLMTLKSLEDILCVVSSLAMKGSLVIGEIPVCLAETDVELKTSNEEWMRKLFMRHGFQVRVIDYKDVARTLGRDLSEETSSTILFVAEHVRFSDDQMEIWRSEFQRTEEEGDEEGFEDQ